MTAGATTVFAGCVMGRGSDPSGIQAGFALLAERAARHDRCAAQVCHGVAGLLERVGEYPSAEMFHRRAGLVLVGLPTGDEVDRDRIRWARCLAANLVAQSRHEDAEDVLRAAVVLSESLLGPDDPERAETARVLDGLTRRIG